MNTIATTEKREYTGVEIPDSYLKGRESTDYFVIEIKGSDMYPDFKEGDKVMCLKQNEIDYNNQICVIDLFDRMWLRKITYSEDKSKAILQPSNPNIMPIIIEEEDIDCFDIIGIPKLVIRDLDI